MLLWEHRMALDVDAWVKTLTLTRELNPSLLHSSSPPKVILTCQIDILLSVYHTVIDIDVCMKVPISTKQSNPGPSHSPSLPTATQVCLYSTTVWPYVIIAKTSIHSHLQISLDAFPKASQLLNSPSRNVFQHAFDWATLASYHSYLGSIEAFRVAIGLLPHFAWLGPTTTQRYRGISPIKNLAVRAVSASTLLFEHALALE
jgi:hypothetical protein